MYIFGNCQDALYGDVPTLQEVIQEMYHQIMHNCHRNINTRFETDNVINAY